MSTADESAVLRFLHIPSEGSHSCTTPQQAELEIAHLCRAISRLRSRRTWTQASPKQTPARMALRYRGLISPWQVQNDMQKAESQVQAMPNVTFAVCQSLLSRGEALWKAHCREVERPRGCRHRLTKHTLHVDCLAPL